MMKLVVTSCLIWFLFILVSQSVAEQPNIVIILVDDMGYGDAACYNRESKIPTPNIDSLAAEGMRFTDAHAPGPLCHLSRYGLITGQYPFRGSPGQWSKRPTVDSGQMTIASLLQANGYQTAMVGKWHLGFHENGYEQPMTGGPIDIGFDSFFGIRASTDIPPYFYIRGDRAVVPPTQSIEANRSAGWSPIQGAFWRKGKIAPGLELKDVLPRFTQEAIDVIDRHALEQQKSRERKPLMLYLAYPAPHTPWLPSPEFEDKSKASMYGDFTHMVDAHVGKVLGALDRNSMSDNTLVIFTSDNGPVWYEKDVERFQHDSSGGLRGMKADAWECGHRMPFLVRWPGIVKAGSVSSQIICFTDLLATFAELVESDLPENAGPDSFSFLPVLKGTQPVGQPVRPNLVIVSGNSKIMTVRDGKWKLINSLKSGGFSRQSDQANRDSRLKGQLYDLESDLGETRNLYLDYPDRVSEMTRTLKTIVESGTSKPSKRRP